MTILECPECGWRSGRDWSPAMAAAKFRLHSCESQRRRREIAARAAARRTRSGPEAPCAHDGRHQHGDRNRYAIDKCRCRRCRDAAQQYEQWRRKQRAYGRPAYIDAGPTREHVNALRAQGMGWKRVARAAGLSTSVVWKLLYGDPERGLAPSKRIRPATAEALLAVELDIAPAAPVDAGPTWDRIKGLVALGYPLAWIARQIGQRGTGLQLHKDRCSQRHADTIRDLAEKYATIPGPSARARRYAAARGWTPALLWDVDDESATDEVVDAVLVERAVAGRPVELNPGERAEVVRLLTARGLSARQIADRVGCSQRQVVRDRATTQRQEAS